MPTRPTNPMPNDVRRMLLDASLLEDFGNRPRYQRNDYLGWIDRAKRSATRTKRISQMLDELRLGGIYMKMEHPPSRKGGATPEPNS